MLQTIKDVVLQMIPNITQQQHQMQPPSFQDAFPLQQILPIPSFPSQNAFQTQTTERHMKWLLLTPKRDKEQVEHDTEKILNRLTLQLMTPCLTQPGTLSKTQRNPRELREIIKIAK